MKLRKFSKQILSLVLALFIVAGACFSVDFLPEFKADAASTYDTITDLYHDAAEPFLSNIQPAAGETVTIRMRAVKGNLSSAKLFYYNTDTGTTKNISMTKSSTTYDRSSYYEYWEASFTVPDSSMIRYWFSATNRSGSIYREKTYYLLQYNNNLHCNIITSAPSMSNHDDRLKCWILTPRVQTPDWAKGSTWYSFVPDEFFNGNPSNDDFESDGNKDLAWNNKIPNGNLNNRYGGDFEGVMDKLAYIKSLGVNGVCFNPVNSANQSVGYGSSNFNQIESTFGNAQTYKEFINFMHNNDLRIMQDIAVYHTANDSVIVNSSNRWPTLGAGLSGGNAVNVESPYYSVIVDHKLSNDKITTQNWGGSIINHADPTTQALLWSTKEGALVRYANDALGFGVDGYRFDCGGWIVGHDENGKVVGTDAIMQEIRKAIKAVNPEAVVLSEASSGAGWSNNTPIPVGQLNSGAWDATWNLNFLRYVTAYNDMKSIANEYNKDTKLRGIRGLALSQMRSINRQTLLCSHLQANTHDEQGKFFAGENNGRMTSIKLMQMTLIGSPSVYFGEETNYTNGTNYGFSYFNWDESTWNYDVMNFTKALLELRNEFTAVRTGAFVDYGYVDNGDYWHYGRFDENGAVLTVLNATTSATTYTLSAYKMGLAAGETLTDWFTGKTYTVGSNGNVTVAVPVGGTIYVTGGKRSTYVDGFNATSITNDVSGNLKFNIGGTETVLTNGRGSVSVGANGTATITNVTLGNKFAISGDYTFTAASSSTQQANHLGLSIGETTVDGTTYKVGVVLRPYISAGVQAILCLTSGVADTQSKWISVFSGPAITKGASNTVNFKLEYDNGILKAYFNDVYKSQIDVSAYDIEFAPEFFTRGGTDPITFSLSNVKVTGEVEADNDASSGEGYLDNTIFGYNNYTITSTEDNIVFYNQPAFGAYSFAMNLNCMDYGVPVSMIRDGLNGDSAYYAVVNELNEELGSTYTVYVRDKDGALPRKVTTIPSSSAYCVKIERDENNVFRTYLGTYNSGSINYVLMSGSEATISMDETTYAGFSCLDGWGYVDPVGITYPGDKLLSDDFSGSVLNPLLNGSTQSASESLSGGKLTIKPGDILTARTPANDWTFKTKLTYTPATENDIAGIVNYQDADTYLVLGRTIRDGKVKLYFGKNSDGKLATLYMMDDPNPTADVTLQLQRIGTVYTAVYSYDELTWYSLGDSVFYNLSNENPGVASFGGVNASFDYVTFGNAVNDGVSYNTPHTPDLEQFDLTVGKFSGTYALKALSGTWTDASEGYYQTDSGLAHLIVHNKKYAELRAEATLKLESGAQWVGLNFGRATADAEIGNGYLVKYTSAGTVVLEKNGVAVDTYTLTDEAVDGGFLRVLVECFNGNVYVSIGQKAKIVFELLDCDYVSGYFSFATNGPARVNNMNVLSMSAQTQNSDAVSYSDAGVQISNLGPVYTISETISGTTYTYYESQYIAKYATSYGTDGEGNATEEAIEAARAKFKELLDETNVKRVDNKYFASVRGVASTDFVISANFNFVRKYSKKTTDWNIAENKAIETANMPNYATNVVQQMGLVLCGSVGMNDVEDGIYVKFTSDGKLHLEKGGVSLCDPYTIPGSPLSIKVMVVKKNGTFSVYVDGGKTPVITYTEAASNGGAYTFINKNGVSIFDAIMVDDLNPGDDYTTSKVYTDWMSGANLANKGGYYFNDFNNNTSLYDDEWVTYLGDVWEIKDGVLTTTDLVPGRTYNEDGSQKFNGYWDTGVSYAGGVYSDFIFNFKMYVPSDGGYAGTWASVGFRRISPETGHQNNGSYLIFGGNGKITRLSSYNIAPEDLSYENSKTSFGSGSYMNGWQNFTLVVQGTSIRLYSDGKLLYHGQETMFREGFITLKTGDRTVYYDDVKIIPLSTRSAPVVDAETNIADDLKVNVNGVDYTNTYKSSKTIIAGANQAVTFSNFNALRDKFNLSAKLERTTQNEGCFETKIGVVEYAGERYDLVVRINPFVSPTGIYSNAELCLTTPESKLTLDYWNIDPLGTNKSSYELDVAYESNKLSVWIDNQTAFVEEIDLAEYGVELVLPELAFNSTNCGIKISNLAVFGGATAQELVSTTITDGFTFKGENDENYTYDYILDGILTLDSSKAFIKNADVLFLTGISANVKLDSSDYDDYNYNFGFILGTGRKNGVTSPVYAVLSQKSKKAEIYFGSTKIYTAGIKIEPQFGDNIFWDDDEEHITEEPGFTVKNEFDIAVESTRNNTVTFSIDGITAYTVSLATLGISNFKATPGFVSNGIEVVLSNIELSGIGAYTLKDIENVTKDIFIDNVSYAENGSYTVTGSSVNTLNNILLGSQKFYFVGATFSSLDASDKASICLGNWAGRSVEIAVNNDYIKVILGANNGVGAPGYMEESFEITPAEICELAVGYTEDGISAWVNDKKVISNYYAPIDTFEFAVKTNSETDVTVSKIAAWGTLAAKVSVEETENGSVKVLSSDKQNGITVITVKPEEGYQLVAGSLKFIDENGVTRNVISRYNDENPNEFAIYDVGSKVKVTAEFTDMSVTSITTATIGSNLHTFNDTISGIERIDGVRFLTRLYMPISNINPQTGTITVNYNGKVYTVEDYGALMIPTTIMDKQGIAYKDLSFDNMEQLTARNISAKSGAVYYSSADYLDFTVVVTVPRTDKTGSDRDTYYGKYYAREYVLRSYAVLRPEGATDSSSDITIYGQSFTDSINNVVERMESEGK